MKTGHRLYPDRPFVEKLREMEEGLCRLPGWIDHGTHVLIVAKSRLCEIKTSTEPNQSQLQSSVVTCFAEFLAGKS